MSLPFQNQRLNFPVKTTCLWRFRREMSLRGGNRKEPASWRQQLPVSAGNQNRVRVWRRVAGANQANHSRNALFEFDVRFVRNGNALEGRGEFLADGRRVVFKKLFGLASLREMMVRARGGDELAHG